MTHVLFVSCSSSLECNKPTPKTWWESTDPACCDILRVNSSSRCVTQAVPILNPTFIAFVVAAPNLLGSPALHSVTMPFAARTSSVCIATMKTPSSLFETHKNDSPRQRTMKKRVKKHEKNPSETGVGNGATGARPGGGFWGHLKYYINRRDCVRSQLSSELRKITILHEIPPFLGSKMSPKMRKIC